MAATFVIDTPAVLALGLVASWLSPEAERRGPFWLEWPFGHGLAMTALVLATAVASWAVAPDWMFMYFLPGSAATPLGLAYIGLLLYAVPYACAFAAGRELRRRSRLCGAFVLVAILALQIGVVVHLGERYARVGTLAEWQAGGGVPLARYDPLTRVSFVGGASVLAVLGLTVAGRRGRRLRALAQPGMRHLNDGEERVVSALASGLFPDDPQVETLARELSCYLGSMALAGRTGIRVAIFALQWLPVMLGRGIRPLTAMAPVDRDAYLGALDHHPVTHVRLVLVITKTLLAVLYYERPGVLEAIGADFHCRQENRPPAFPDTPRARAVARS